MATNVITNEEIKSQFLSCRSERALPTGFSIYWAVMLYCEIFNKTIDEIREFLKEFSTKALHMGYAATIGVPVIHHGCFCKFCKIHDHCGAILIERGKMADPTGYYPITIKSIDEWAPDVNKPLSFFNLYFHYTTNYVLKMLVSFV